MQHTHHRTVIAASRGSRGARPGFTLVELLVVVGIIALLIGLLLPALGKVVQRAKSTQTMGTMQNFAKACDAYFQEFGEYPAAVPDSVLYRGTGQDAQLPRITAMENALLALMAATAPRPARTPMRTTTTSAPASTRTWSSSWCSRARQAESPTSA